LTFETLSHDDIFTLPLPPGGADALSEPEVDVRAAGTGALAEPLLRFAFGFPIPSTPSDMLSSSSSTTIGSILGRFVAGWGAFFVQRLGCFELG
jgi:hypothetical protein